MREAVSEGWRERGRWGKEVIDRGESGRDGQLSLHYYQTPIKIKNKNMRVKHASQS